MSENQNSKMPKIGAFVLETLTTGMYTNPLDALREYVQNSFDAIRRAERAGIIKSGSGRIEIVIDEKKRNIILRDNGTGVSSETIADILINIGMSSKDIQTDAGFRGIGRLAGIAYCKKLYFKTQKMGESHVSTVTFDCEQLCCLMSPQNSQNYELTDVLNKYTSIYIERTRKEDHFFEVRMEGINQAGELFLDLKQLTSYLSQVAPVGLDTQSFYLAGTISNWLLEHNIHIPTVSITISGQTNYQIFKPYRKLTYTTSKEKLKIHVRNIRFFPESAGPDSPFWCWFAETNCPGMFGEDTVAGFRLRKDNIGIGTAELMNEIFAEYSESYARFNKFYMGEIHIQNPNVIPNARRDGFEDSPDWNEIRKSLIEFAHERSREAYALSQARNMDIERLLEAAIEEKDEAEKKRAIGLASKEQKNKIIVSIEKQLSKLDTAKNSNRSDDDILRINHVQNELKAAKSLIEKESRYVAKNLDTSLDKKQRKIISEIIGIIYDVLGDGQPFVKVQDAILSKYKIQSKDNIH